MASFGNIARMRQKQAPDANQGPVVIRAILFYGDDLAGLGAFDFGEDGLY
jgi:hypothetical protein